MSREIKFRVWDTKKRIMVDGFDEGLYLSLNQGLVYINTVGEPMDVEKERYVIQRYTELEDKNRKEIYEGDIVECNDGVGGRMHGEVVYDSEYAAFRIVFTDILQWTFYKVENAEIIGNIFENPELLK